MSLRAHDRDDPARQVVPAKKIGLENGAQSVGGQIFDRSGYHNAPLLKSASSVPPVASTEPRPDRSQWTVCVGIVDTRRVKASAIAQDLRAVCLFAAGRRRPASRGWRRRFSRSSANARRAAGDQNGFAGQPCRLTNSSSPCRADQPLLKQEIGHPAHWTTRRRGAANPSQLPRVFKDNQLRHRVTKRLTTPKFVPGPPRTFTRFPVTRACLSLLQLAAGAGRGWLRNRPG